MADRPEKLERFGLSLKEIELWSHLIKDQRAGGLVRRYFGAGCPPETLKQISDETGLSIERVRQITMTGLRVIKNHEAIYCRDAKNGMVAY
jgi:DNA-directed RNA polymerase sigma subunit (sigma70/sigma32)